MAALGSFPLSEFTQDTFQADTVVPAQGFLPVATAPLIGLSPCQKVQPGPFRASLEVLPTAVFHMHTASVSPPSSL